MAPHIHCDSTSDSLETNDIHANILYGEVAVHVMKSYGGQLPTLAEQEAGWAPHPV